jgi:hypothetical protein
MNRGAKPNFERITLKHSTGSYEFTILGAMLYICGKYIPADAKMAGAKKESDSWVLEF